MVSLPERSQNNVDSVHNDRSHRGWCFVAEGLGYLLCSAQTPRAVKKCLYVTSRVENGLPCPIMRQTCWLSFYPAQSTGRCFWNCFSLSYVVNLTIRLVKTKPSVVFAHRSWTRSSFHQKIDIWISQMLGKYHSSQHSRKSFWTFHCLISFFSLFLYHFQTSCL